MSVHLEQWSVGWLRVLPGVVIGTGCVVAGGALSAATAAAPSEAGAWAAAYLVLVCGVAQVGLALCQQALAPVPLSRRYLATEFLVWNLGNAGVLVGNLAGLTWLLDVGSALLVVALALFLVGVRGHAQHHAALLWGFRVLVAILLVSIPIGTVLGHA